MKRKDDQSDDQSVLQGIESQLQASAQGEQALRVAVEKNLSLQKEELVSQMKQDLEDQQKRFQDQLREMNEAFEQRLAEEKEKIVQEEL